MYEERFVDRIFGEQLRMTKDEFIEKIEGTAAEKAMEELNKLKGRYNFFGGGKILLLFTSTEEIEGQIQFLRWR